MRLYKSLKERFTHEVGVYSALGVCFIALAGALAFGYDQKEKVDKLVPKVYSVLDVNKDGEVDFSERDVVYQRFGIDNSVPLTRLWPKQLEAVVEEFKSK